jgi:hypothetical protein
MNISYTFIEPFEPLCIPTLALIVWEPDELQTIFDNLEMTYKLITDLELDDGSAWARETLEGCAIEAGAISAHVREQPLKGSNRLGYMVYFYLKDGPYERMHMRLLHKKS